MRELVIKMKLDRAQADAAAASHVENLRRIKEAHAANATAAKASSEAAKASAKAAADEVKTQAKAQSEAMNRASREASDAAKRASQESIEAAKRASREAIEAARVASREKIAAARAAAVVERAANREAADEVKDHGSAVASVVAGYATFGAAVKVVGTVAQMWRDQRADIEASVERAGRYRDMLLEIAALNGRPGRTTPELANQLRLRNETLQTAPAALAFQTGSLDTGQASVASGMISQGNLQELMKYAGLFQAARNATPDALGKLTGQIPTLIGQPNVDPKAAFQREVGILATLEKGNGGLTSGVGQFANNSGLSQMGLFKSPEQQAALQAYFSLKAPLAAGTRVDQFTRGTVGALGRMRAGGVEGDESQAAYLKGLGADATLDPLQIGRLIAADLGKQKANDPKFNAYDYLIHHGYREEESRAAVLDFSQGINSGVFDRTFGKEAAGLAVPTFANAMKPLEDWKKVDQTARDRKIDLAKDTTDAARAVGPEEYYNSVKKLAFERLRSRGKVYGEFGGWNPQSMWGGAVIDEAQRMMIDAGAKVGVKPPEGSFADAGIGMGTQALGAMGLGTGGGAMGGHPLNRIFTSEATRAKAFYDFGNQISAAGGNPLDMSVLVDAMNRNTDQAKKIEDAILKGQGRAGQGGGGPMAPIPPPLRGRPDVQTRNP